MNTLQLFKFESNEIRFVDGKPVANDVAKVLGYSHPAKTVSTKVKETNRTVTKMVTVDGKLRNITVLEEAGIYQLIFSSKLPHAQKFQDWVFNEVLPSIRKTGKYEVAKEVELPTTYLEALKALVASEEAKLALEAKIETDKPKVDFADAVAFSDNSLEFNEYAKIIGLGRNKLMAKLRKLNILMPNSTLPYQRWIDAGYFECSQEIIGTGKTVPFALITGKGQLWLKQRLDENMSVEKQSSFSFSPDPTHKRLKGC